jgi:hypothetical protein
MYKEKVARQNPNVPVRREWLIEAAPSEFPYPQIVRLSVAIVLLLSVTWLGARGLNADALWYDEVWSLYYAGGAEFGPISPAETIARVGSQLQHEKNPPGYYVILNLWGSAAGWSEYAGRSLSLLMGVLAVAWTYRLGCDMAAGFTARSRRLIGLVAAAAVGGSAFFAYYTHEMRAYVPSVLLTVLLLWLYWRFLHLKREPRWFLQIAFVLTLAGSLYIHYSSILVIGAMGLHHLLAVPKNRRWWRLTLFMLGGGVLFLPWAGSLLMATQRAENLSLTALTTPQMLGTLIYVFSNGSVALLLLVVIYAMRARGRQAGSIWFLAASGVALVVILNAVYPVITHIRYLIVLWPLLGLVVGLGIERVSRRGVGGGVVLAIWVGAGLWNTFDPAFNRDLSATITPMPWREVRAEVENHSQPNDVLVFHAPDFHWYRDLEMQHYMAGLPLRYSLLEKIPGLEAHDEYYERAGMFIADAERVWLGVDKTFASNFRLAALERVLAEKYAHCSTIIDQPDMRLDLYGRRPATLEKLTYHFSDGVGLQMVEPVRMTSNGKMAVGLGWWVDDDVPGDTYSVGLHVVDESGNIVTQADYGLPSGGYHCTASIIDVPAGTYQIMAMVYNWRTGERLEATGDGDAIPIATIAVQ